MTVEVCCASDLAKVNCLNFFYTGRTTKSLGKRNHTDFMALEHIRMSLNDISLTHLCFSSVPSDHSRPLLSFLFSRFSPGLTPPGEASRRCRWRRWWGLCFLLGNWSQWAASWLCLHLNLASLENPASQTHLASLAGPAVVLHPTHTIHSLVKVLIKRSF